MVEIIHKFFAFCGEENRKKFRASIWLGVAQAMFEALKIPAVACMARALLAGQVTARDVLLSLGIMLLSIVGAGLIKAKATMLQTEGGYDTCAKKRVEIAEHMRYLPMGYFNENSLGQITSVTTNVMESLENVATRVVMLVCEGLLTTALIIVMLLFFDWRVALVGWGVFLLLWATTKYVSLGSVCAAVALPVITWVVYRGNDSFAAIFALSLLMAAMVLWAHRGNIQRLLSGTESKFEWHKGAPRA